MRQIKGYVCVTKHRIGEREIFTLFGKGNAEQDFLNLISNNYSPYRSLDEAEKGRQQLDIGENYDEIRIAEIEMTIAENRDEIQQLKSSKSLVAIMDAEPNYRPAYGAVVKGKPCESACPPRARIEKNGLVTFRSLDEAVAAAGEITRQAEAGFTIASFSLRYVD